MFLASGHRGGVHPAATCLVGELARLLCSPCWSQWRLCCCGLLSLNRWKYEDTWWTGIHPYHNSCPSNACSVDTHFKEGCNSQGPSLSVVDFAAGFMIKSVWFSHQKTIQSVKAICQEGICQCATHLWNTSVHGSCCLQTYLEISEEREPSETQKTDGRDSERQFTALTFPKTTATQLTAVFAWTALKIP